MATSFGMRVALAVSGVMTLVIGLYPEPFLQAGAKFAAAIRTICYRRYSHNPLFTPIVVTVVIIALFPLVAGYIVLVERKVLADFQVRAWAPCAWVRTDCSSRSPTRSSCCSRKTSSRPNPIKAIFWFAPCMSTIHGAHGVRRAAVRQDDLRGGCERRSAGDFGSVGGGHSGDHSGRMVVQQPLFAARCAAQRGTTGELRSGSRRSRCFPA